MYVCVCIHMYRERHTIKLMKKYSTRSVINWALSRVVGQSKIGSACLEIVFAIFLFLFPGLFLKKINRELCNTLCMKTFVILWFTIMKY